MLATIRSRTYCLPAYCLKTEIRTWKTIILPVVLHGCETWTLTLREEHRLSVFEDRMQRRIFEPKGNEVAGRWRNCIMRNFVICILRQV
jgi:hypothetical protein